MKFNMRINPSRKNRVLALITLAGLATTGTLMATAPEHDAADIEEKAWPVTTMTLEARALSPELRLFGRVETPRHAQLTAAVTATVDTLSISEGELVEAGQVLMTLDEADEELRLLQRTADTTEAQAKLDSTRREFAVDTQVLQHMQELHELTLSKRRRLDTLQQQNLVAAEQLEDTRAMVARQAIQLAQQQLRVDNHPQRLTMAEAAVDRSRALMQEQELRLSRTVIVAPFRGRISHIDAAPGDRVREGEILLAMYDTDALQVRVTLPRNAIASIKRALAADDTISAQLNDSSMTLRLHQLAAEVSRGRSGVDGLFKVIGNGDTLELGKAVNITVVMPPLADVATVPVQSLYGDNRIYAIFEGRLQGVEVDTLGQRTDDQGRVELLIRPQQGELPEEILTTSLPRASTGLRVNVING
ncbi:MAG: HlyD family efflux transporter periplasmic adaptor subunit [Gammaproteobacteria bacterium]|nr:HlyD family efflux transporter periplasmic adaptor subunit [Gammaproteobacteria bacterium]